LFGVDPHHPKRTFKLAQTCTYGEDTIQTIPIKEHKRIRMISD